MAAPIVLQYKIAALRERMNTTLTNKSMRIWKRRAELRSRILVPHREDASAPITLTLAGLKAVLCKKIPASYGSKSESWDQDPQIICITSGLDVSLYTCLV